MSAAPGWYPDPAGEPDRYRYWDGQAWSAQTSADPSHGPPSGAPRPGPRRPRALRWLGILAVVVLAVVMISVLIRIGRGLAPPNGPVPSATVSGADGSTPSPSPDHTPSASGEPGLAVCAKGDPNERAAHPDDGRVYGGNLSFPRVPGYNHEAAEPRLGFARDVAQQTRSVNPYPAWIAQLAVGRLRSRDGYPTGDPRHAAEIVLDCLAGGSMYVPFDDHPQELRSVPHAVSGHDGWLIEANITVTVPGLPFPGDRVIVAVTEDGDDWGVFFGAAPIGDDALQQVLDDTVAALAAS